MRENTFLTWVLCPRSAAPRGGYSRSAGAFAPDASPPVPWNFFLIYVGASLYFMSYSLEAATGSLTLLYFNSKGWGNAHRDILYVACMCTQAAMPIYAAPLLGLWARRRHIKSLLLYCQLVSLAGCLLAAVANRRLVMLVAMNLMAVSGYSTQPLRSSYIARAVQPRVRTKWMAALALSMLLGAAVSPFITLACSSAPLPAQPTRAQAASWAYWSVNRYTLVYLTGAVVTALVAVLTAAFFREFPNDRSSGKGGTSAGDLAVALAEARWRRLRECDRASYRSVQAYFAALFACDGISQGMMSVAIYPVLGDIYEMSAAQMSLITIVLSFVALLPPALAACLSTVLSDRVLMSIGLALKSVGVLFTLIPDGGSSSAGRWLFLVGYILIVKASLFFLMSGTSNLTKQLGDQATPLNMSFNVMARNFGNFAGMALAGPFILSWYHTWAWLVISLPLGLAWLLLLHPHFWARLDCSSADAPRWVAAWAALRLDDDPGVLQSALASLED